MEELWSTIQGLQKSLKTALENLNQARCEIVELKRLNLALSAGGLPDEDEAVDEEESSTDVVSDGESFASSQATSTALRLRSAPPPQRWKLPQSPLPRQFVEKPEPNVRLPKFFPCPATATETTTFNSSNLESFVAS